MPDDVRVDALRLRRRWIPAFAGMTSPSWTHESLSERPCV